MATAMEDRPTFVGPEEALIILKNAGLPMQKWRLYQLARDGHLPPGRVVLREGARKLLFRVEGLQEWVASGGNISTAA